MEYVNLIQRIISAEQSAQDMVHDAREEESHLAEHLTQEVEEMRTQYMDKAKHRIEKLTRLEAAMAQEDLEKWDEKLTQTMAHVELAYSQNKDQWVDTLFYKVIGTQP